jgi:hypothetical protein
MNHIREKLPDMEARLINNTLMGQAQQELNSFGDEAIHGDTNQVCPSCPDSSPFSNHTSRHHSKVHSSSGS